jgi:hypothetical protein
MELIERWPRDLLVQIAHCHGVSEQLVQLRSFPDVPFLRVQGAEGGSRFRTTEFHPLADEAGAVH